MPNICVASPQRRCRRSWGRRALLGVEQRFRDGRRAGHRGLRLRHAHRAARRPHRRAGQHLRRRGQETAGGRSGHRLRGRPHRDPDHRRAMAIRATSRPTCWRRPSTMWTPRRILLTTSKRLADAVSQRNRTAACGSAHRRRGARKAIARNQRHDAGARRSTRPSSFPTASRPSTSAFPTIALLAAHPHAGSVFVGPFSPEAAGDYASGPNHVLPTGGAARCAAGCRSPIIVKVISVQQTQPRGACRAGARHHHAGPRRGSGSARALRRGADK